MRPASARRTVDRTPNAVAPHLPLRRLALCVDCEACFVVGPPSCPACSGRTWTPLAGFLDQRPVRLLSHPFSKSRDDSTKAVSKQVLVIARDREKLYGYLRRAFLGNPTVEVVLDRRRTERRRTDEPRVPDRRRAGRRFLDIDHQLRSLGWAVVRLDVFREAAALHKVARG